MVLESIMKELPGMMAMVYILLCFGLHMCMRLLKIYWIKEIKISLYVNFVSEGKKTAKYWALVNDGHTAALRGKMSWH